MKTRHRVITAAFLVLAAVSGFVLFLPALLSTGPARRAVLAAVNARLDGSLEVATWSLRWRGGMALDGLAFEDSGRGVMFRADTVRTSSGLLNVLRARKDLGTIDLVAPDVRWTPPERPFPPAAPGGGAEGARSRPSGAPEVEERAPARLPELSGRLNIHDGRLVAALPDRHPPLVLEALNGTLELPAFDAPLTFDLEGRQAARGGTPGSSPGAFSAKGSAELAPGGIIRPGGPKVDALVRLQDLDVAPFAALAAEFAGLPGAEGLVSGSAAVNMDGSERLSVKGQLGAAGLELTGGPLGKDSPSFARLTVDTDIALGGGELAVRELAVESPQGRINVSGRLRAGRGESVPRGALSVQARFDLAQVAASFPATLKVREGLRVTGGTATLEAETAAEGDGFGLTALLRVSNLEAEREGRKIALESPIRLLLRGRHGPRGVALDDLRFESSFGRIQGKGTPDGIEAAVSIDLSAAMVEAGKFLDTGGCRLGGKLEGSLRSDVAEGRRRSASVTMTWTNAEFQRGALRIREDEIGLNVTGELDGKDIRLQTLALRSAPLSVAASGGVGDWKAIRALELSGTLTPDFARLAAFLSPTSALPLTVEGREPGAFKVMTRLGAGEGTAILKSTEAEADLRLSRLRAFGIDAREVRALVRLAAGRVQVEITARVNEGTLSAAPVLDLAGDVATLEIPHRTDVLKRVKLTDEMMAELMTLVNPLLRTSTVLGGLVDMTLEPFRVPLGPRFKSEAAFSGSIGFHDISLAPSGAMSELLDVLGLDSGAVTISNEVLKVACADGWIRPDMLTLRSGTHVLRLSGAMALDGRLKYTAEIPVTEKMVGREVYAHLRDASLKLPIGGTVARPVISKQAYRALLGDLIRNASRKFVAEQGKQLLDNFLQKLEKKRTGAGAPPPAQEQTEARPQGE